MSDRLTVTLLEEERGRDRNQRAASSENGKAVHRFLGMCSVPLIQFFRRGRRVSLTRGSTYLFDNSALTSRLAKAVSNEAKGCGNPSFWENVVLQFHTVTEADLFVEALVQGNAEEILIPPVMPDNATEVLRSRSSSRANEFMTPASTEVMTPVSRSSRKHGHSGSPQGRRHSEKPRQHQEETEEDYTRTHRPSDRHRSSSKQPALTKGLSQLVKEFMRYEHHRQHMLVYMHRELVHQAFNAAAKTVVYQKPVSFSKVEREKLAEIERKVNEAEALYQDVQAEKRALEKERKALEREKRALDRHPHRSTSQCRAETAPATNAGRRHQAADEAHKVSVNQSRNRSAARAEYLLRRFIPGSGWAAAFFPHCELDVRHAAVQDIALAAKLPRSCISMVEAAPVKEQTRSERAEEGLLLVAKVRYNEKEYPKEQLEERLEACEFQLLQYMYCHRDGYKAFKKQAAIEHSHSRSSSESSAGISASSRSPSNERNRNVKDVRQDRSTSYHTPSSHHVSSSALLRQQGFFGPSSSSYSHPYPPRDPPSMSRTGGPGGASHGFNYPPPPPGSSRYGAPERDRPAPTTRAQLAPALPTKGMLASMEAVDRAVLEVAAARQRRLIMDAFRHRTELLDLQRNEEISRRMIEFGAEPLECVVIQAHLQPLKSFPQALVMLNNVEASHREKIEQVEKEMWVEMQREGRQILSNGVAQTRQSLEKNEHAERLLIESEAISQLLDLVAYDQRRRGIEAVDQLERHQRSRGRSSDRLLKDMMTNLVESERDEREAIQRIEAKWRSLLRQEMLEGVDELEEQRRLSDRQKQMEAATVAKTPIGHTATMDSREVTSLTADGRRRNLESQRRVKLFHYMTFTPEDMDFKPNADSAIEGILGCTINRNLEVVEISRPLLRTSDEDGEFQAGDMILDASGQALHSLSHLREVLSHRIMLIQEEARAEFKDLPEEELTTNPALQKYIEVLCEHHNFLMQVLRGCEIFQLIVKS